MSQTSPRAGVGIVMVKGLKEIGRSGSYLLVLQRTGIERQRSAQNLVGKGALILGWQGFEGFDQGRDFSAHTAILAHSDT